MSTLIGLDFTELLSGVASRLVETSVVGGLLAIAVCALCRLVPALPPAVRCWLWWGVALKMLLGLLPLPAVAVPLLPGVREASAAAVRRDAREDATGAEIAVAGFRAETSKRTGGAATATMLGGRGSRGVLDAASAPAALTSARSRSTRWPQSPIPWRVPLAALWLAGLTVELTRAGVHLLRARRVVRTAEPVTDPTLLATFDALRRRLDVPAAELRISRAAATPQVVGVRRPVVLLPHGMRERLDGEELLMALGHELLHVRRADLLLGLVPALAARCFFFHPLARLVEREHALAREEACDAAVVARLAPSPRAYGRLLLELALGCGAPLRAAAAAVTHTTLQRRLQMLLKPARPFRPALVAPLLLLGVCALVPLRVTAREGAAPASPAVEPALVAETAPYVEPASAAEPDPAVEPAPASEPNVQPEPLAVLAMADKTEMINSPPLWEHDAWVYLRDARHQMMSGERADVDRARRQQTRNDEPLFWARRDDEEWVVRDAAFLARLEEIHGPMRELGARQAELGAKQAELGGKQAELGAMQAQLGAQQAQLGAQQATLGSQQATINAQTAQLNARQAALDAQLHADGEAARAEIERRRGEIESARRELDRQVHQLQEQQDELGRMQNQLGDRQNELGGKQGELGEKQNELGERQNELGHKQQEASERAERQLGELLDEAIRSGVAKRVQ